MWKGLTCMQNIEDITQVDIWLDLIIKENSNLIWLWTRFTLWLHCSCIVDAIVTLVVSQMWSARLKQCAKWHHLSPPPTSPHGEAEREDLHPHLATAGRAEVWSHKRSKAPGISLLLLGNISYEHGHSVHISCTWTNKLKKIWKKTHTYSFNPILSMYKILSSNSLYLAITKREIFYRFMRLEVVEILAFFTSPSLLRF
jgi:hypothetical protein